MSLKSKLIIDFLLLCLAFAGCLGSSGQTPCKIRAIYVLQNARTDTVSVKTIDSAIVWTGIDVNILIRNDSAKVFPGSEFNDTVDYSWTGVHGCGITGGADGSKDAFRICTAILTSDSITSNQFLWPIDTARLVLRVCSDCTQEIFDTLVIR